MLRRCDGTDPNLLRLDPATCPACSSMSLRRRELVSCGLPCDAAWHDSPAYVPCDCGQVFNDVNTIVIYPHERF
jgi:hypothetical protein